ncbi:MAG: hypothetical protein ACI9K2_005255 [Myxococcota bacterium]|jgi:hypothetical protein
MIRQGPCSDVLSGQPVTPLAEAALPTPPPLPPRPAHRAPPPPAPSTPRTPPARANRAPASTSRGSAPSSRRSSPKDPAATSSALARSGRGRSSVHPHHPTLTSSRRTPRSGGKREARSAAPNPPAPSVTSRARLLPGVYPSSWSEKSWMSPLPSRALPSPERGPRCPYPPEQSLPTASALGVRRVSGSPTARGSSWPPSTQHTRDQEEQDAGR